MQCPNTFGTLLEHHYYSARKLTVLLLLNKKMQILICIQVNKQAFFCGVNKQAFEGVRYRILIWLGRNKCSTKHFCATTLINYWPGFYISHKTIQQPCCPKNINTFSILFDPCTSLTMKFSLLVDLRWPQISSFSDKRCLVAPREAF